MGKWTEDEIRTLKDNYNLVTNEVLAKMLPEKSALAIYKKALSLGMKKDKAISFQNRSIARKGEKSSSWKGGVLSTTKGYKCVMMPRHHRANSRGYVLEHILVFEKATGISVPKNCCIHHINGNKQDNRIENLCLMLTTAHTAFHNKNRVYSAEQRHKISIKAKERFKDKRNHPSYKDVDITSVKKEINAGKTVKEACKQYGISRSTYYSKIKEEHNNE